MPTITQQYAKLNNGEADATIFECAKCGQRRKWGTGVSPEPLEALLQCGDCEKDTMHNFVGFANEGRK